MAAHFQLKNIIRLQKSLCTKKKYFFLYCPRLSSKSGLGAIVAGIIFPFATEARVRQLMLPIQKHYKQDEFKSLYPILGRETLATIKDVAALSRYFKMSQPDYVSVLREGNAISRVIVELTRLRLLLVPIPAMLTSHVSDAKMLSFLELEITVLAYVTIDQGRVKKRN